MFLLPRHRSIRHTAAANHPRRLGKRRHSVLPQRRVQARSLTLLPFQLLRFYLLRLFRLDYHLGNLHHPFVSLLNPLNLFDISLVNYLDDPFLLQRLLQIINHFQSKLLMLPIRKPSPFH